MNSILKGSRVEEKLEEPLRLEYITMGSTRRKGKTRSGSLHTAGHSNKLVSYSAAEDVWGRGRQSILVF